MDVGLGFRRDDAFRQTSAVVFNEAVLPFEEFGDGLGLNADFHPAQAGEKQIHLPHEAGFTALAVARRLHRQAHFARLAFQQSPALWQFLRGDHSRGSQVKTLTTHALRWVFAAELFPVGKEISAGDFAFNQHGAVLAFPADHVRGFPAGAGLFRQDDSATVTSPQPVFPHTDQLSVGHDDSFSAEWATWLVA
jgi:hypothetical protein